MNALLGRSIRPLSKPQANIDPNTVRPMEAEAILGNRHDRKPISMVGHTVFSSKVDHSLDVAGGSSSRSLAVSAVACPFSCLTADFVCLCFTMLFTCVCELYSEQFS